VKFVRCIGASALIAGVLLIFPNANPAMATNEPTVTVSSPSDDFLAQAPFPITGSAHAEGNQGVITKLSVTLSGDDGWTAPTTQNYSGSAGGVFSGGGGDVSFNWANNAPAYNGPYTVTVVAQGTYQAFGTRDTNPTTVHRTVHVEIPPATPTGVSASKPDDSTVATVKWNKNAEPDMAGYDIWRSYQGAAAKRIGGTDASKTSFTDDLAGQAPGQYKYGVYAVRHARSCKSSSNVDEACSRPIASKQAGQSSAVTVRGQTTTTTTIKKSGGGGSTGGGSTGGGSTGGGSTGGGSTSGGSTSGGTKSGGARSGATGGFAPGGEVDLSKFGSLLNPGAKSGGSSRVTEPDGTFDETLPYGERPVNKPKDDNSLITIGGASLPKPSDDWVKFIGLGSFVTALLVHVLWFKQQVDRLPLEALE
jgi:hypothetical protein